MKYPFRYNKPNIGDYCWFATQDGPVKSKIVDKHDHYYNMDPTTNDRGNQEDYLIDYWIEDYPHHGLVFGEDLFETKEECSEVYATMTIEYVCDICRKTGGVENFGFATDIEVAPPDDHKYLKQYINYDICGDCMKMIHRDFMYELETLNREKLVEFNRMFVKIAKFHISRLKGK